jgi:hypothetical protein
MDDTVRCFPTRKTQILVAGEVAYPAGSRVADSGTNTKRRDISVA